MAPRDKQLREVVSSLYLKGQGKGASHQRPMPAKAMEAGPLGRCCGSAEREGGVEDPQPCRGPLLLPCSYLLLLAPGQVPVGTKSLGIWVMHSLQVSLLGQEHGRGKPGADAEGQAENNRRCYLF